MGRMMRIQLFPATSEIGSVYGAARRVERITQKQRNVIFFLESHTTSGQRNATQRNATK